MENKKCKHLSCTCPALPLHDYCGDVCMAAAAAEEAGEEPLKECQCGHEDCGNIPAETQGLFMASEMLAAS